MRKKDLRKERRRHRIEENKISILQAAEKIFALKGYSLATMDDIAEEAQFSKATLYKYFKSKREMFLEIIYSSFEEMHQKMTRIQQKEMSAEKKLKELIRYISSYYHKKRNIGRIFMMEKAAVRKILSGSSKEQPGPSFPHPPIPAYFRAKMEEIFNIMCDIISEGVKTGEFRKVDVKEACFVLGAMIRGFHFRGPIPRHKDYSIAESTDLLHDFFFYGIKGPRKV